MKKLMIIFVFVNFQPMFTQESTNEIYYGSMNIESWFEVQEICFQKEDMRAISISENTSLFYTKSPAKTIIIPAVSSINLQLETDPSRGANFSEKDIIEIDKMKPKILLSEDQIKIRLIYLKPTEKYPVRYMVIIGYLPYIISENSERVAVAYPTAGAAKEILKKIRN